MDPLLNLDERSEYLDGLEKFISQSWERLKFVTESLGWDLEHFEEEEREMVSCPLNPEHRMPAETLEAHLERCRRRREGYAEDDPELPEPSREVSSPSCVLIDEELQQKILTDPSTYPAAYIVVARMYLVGILPMRGGSRRPVPRTADRARADFTPAERLAVYNYAVANTQSPAVVKAEELNLTYKKNEESRPKSKLELLMEMRDAKRRRISYRSKKVHTSRKSHLEILREVIGNQMEFLEEMNKPEGEEEEEEEREKEPPMRQVDQTSNGEKTADGKGKDPDEALWEDNNRETYKQSPSRGEPHSSRSNLRRDEEHKRWRHGDHKVSYKKRRRSSEGRERGDRYHHKSDSREHADRYHRRSESREHDDRYHRGSESWEREDRYHRRPESQERGDGYHRRSRSHHRHQDVEPYGPSKKRRRRSSESLRSEERDNDFGSRERDDRNHRGLRSHHHRHRDVDSLSRLTEAEPYESSEKKKRRRRSESPRSEEERENDFGKAKKSSKSHKKKKKRKKHRSRSSAEDS